MTVKLNFLVDDLHKNQLAFYLTSELNKAPQNIAPIVFVETLTPFTIPNKFPVMQSAEAWNQSGIMVATSAAGASKILHFPCCFPKVWYIWDLNWIRGHRRMYEPYLNLFAQKDLLFICRSQTHKDIVESSFNCKIEGIVDNFNLEQLITAVGSSC